MATSQEFIDALKELFGENATLTHTYVEGLVTEGTDTLRTEIQNTIGLKEADIAALQNAMTTFYDAVDAADLEGADGEIKIADSFTSIFAKIGVNESGLASINTIATNLQTALNTEITARTNADTTVNDLLNTVKTNLQGQITAVNDSIAALTLRVTATEGVANFSKVWIDEVVAGLPQLKTDVIASIKAKLGLPA